MKKVQARFGLVYAHRWLFVFLTSFVVAFLYIFFLFSGDNEKKILTFSDMCRFADGGDTAESSDAAHGGDVYMTCGAYLE